MPLALYGGSDESWPLGQLTVCDWGGGGTQAVRVGSIAAPVPLLPRNCTVAVETWLHSSAAAAGTTVWPDITEAPLTVTSSQPVAAAATKRGQAAEATPS